MEFLFPLLAVLITSIIGPVSVHWYKTGGFRKKKDSVKESLETNVLVTNKIEHLLHSYSADRIWILQFHNGGNFYPTGKSIQKFSMGYELVSSEANSIQSNFQNIPISLFSTSMNRLLEHNVIDIPDFDKPQINTYNLQYSLGLTQCKSTYQFALKSIDNKFIGVLGMDFIHKKVELDGDDLNTLLYEVASIGGVIQKQLSSK